ncbi:MAG: CPBP family intramembrane glutamic endopeptidase [Microcoleaceae cyanobacterium]
MIGVLSLLLINFPLPDNEELPPLWIIKLLTLLQPTVLLSIAVTLGVTFAEKVNLSAPLAEAIARKNSLTPAIKPQILPGIISGLIGGLGLLFIALLWQPFLPSDFVAKSSEISNDLPFVTRIFFGGITEELLMRWGFMTLLVWIGWRIFQRGKGKPQAVYYIIAILLSSILFGVGHLPIAFSFQTQVNAIFISYIIIINSLFGLIVGYLYWQKGLESAMLAHGIGHIVLVIVNQFI